ncbi:hypothetical protein DFH07DRAFT_278605 [Mycena maculata]|uniref:Endoplasmic reticulum junction formation protein lunapark n=1 Tax=Mycena maculata TaxID=230809 RepID=A0AAD7MMW6_9AGAR|nr:hypothetical protein DFH07DRAFT_278605 [Mycena maculata]
MSFLWRLFRAEKPSDDYETVLSNLAANIQKRQTLLSEIRLRERKATMLVTLYALVGWLAYLAVWYFGFVSGGANGRVQGVERALRALPVFVGPILILFIRRIVQIWYNRKGNAEEKTLQTLLKEQRAKVEEIKKKTNFYSTRDLLSRYDGSAPNSPQQRGPTPPQTPPQGAPRKSNANGPSPLAGPNPNPNAKFAPHPNTHPNRNANANPGPSQRKWYDALADLLVGAEDGAGSPASQKYALICERCFAHNGLVPEIAWADAQYTCPKCGHFNPSARSKRQRAPLPASPLPGAPFPVSPVSPVAQGQPAPPASASAITSADGAIRRRAARASGAGEGEEREEMMEVDT